MNYWSNYWYIAHANELFVDTDKASHSLEHTKRRLQGAIECGYLDVKHIMQRPSRTADHVHTIITLNNFLTDIERYVWEIILHGDLYRGCCTIMRGIKHIPCPDVLISPYRYFNNPDGIRHSDRCCRCKEKHKREIMEKCPVAKELRGPLRTAMFFGKPSKNPCLVWPETPQKPTEKRNTVTRKTAK